MGQTIHLGSTPPAEPIEPPEQTDGKRALVLGGGGVAGAAFHIGSLLALNDAFGDFSVNDFDIIVGTSAGAFVGSLLANGVTPETLARSQLGDSTEIPPVKRAEILRKVRGRIPRGLLSSAGAVRSTLRQVTRSRLDTSLVDTFFSVTEGLASWRLYSTKGIESYLSQVLSMEGHTNSFSELHKQLFVIATDLDTAERTVFGEDHRSEASISQAVSASAAIPIIYEPVRIKGREYLDGGLRSATNLDVAVAHGASFVVLVNPLVPYLHDARYLLKGFDSPVLHVSDGGLGRLVAQVFRIMAHAQLEKEIDLVTARYPEVDILVIEPHRDDEHLFVFNLMDWGARVQMARDAFEQVAVDLVTHFPDVQKLFEVAGIDMDKEGLVDQLRQVLGDGTAEALRSTAERGSA